MIYQEKIGLSRKEYEERIRRLQVQMTKHDLDVVLSYGDEGQYTNLYYLSRYWPAFEVGGVLVGRVGRPLVLIGGEAVEFGAMTPFGLESVRSCSDFGHRSGGARNWSGVTFYDLAELLDEVTENQPVKRIGISDYTIFPHVLYERILEICPGVEIVDCSAILDDMRMHKSTTEIDLVRKACHITEKAFEAALGKISPDMTEYQLEGVFTAELFRLGGETPSFPVMCYAGYHSRSGIGRNTHQVVGRNTIINIDFGCRYGGYSSAYDRPIIFGKMTDAMKREFDFMKDVHLKVINEWARPGNTSGDVYRKYADAFIGAGYGNPPASASHGIGVCEGEAPAFREGTTTILESGMTIAGDHFFRSREYGFRLEDCYLIGEKENEMFTSGNLEYIEL